MTAILRVVGRLGSAQCPVSVLAGLVGLVLFLGSCSEATTTTPEPEMGGTLGVEVTATPAATAAGAMIAFTCAVTGDQGAVSYTWEFGDGTISNLQNPFHSYTHHGSYVALCSAKDVRQAAGSATVTIEVGNPATFPALVVTANAEPTTAIVGVPIQFGCAGTGGVPPLTFRWEFGDGSGSANDSPGHSYASAGSFVATCWVSDAANQRGSAAVAVTVEDGIAPPTISELVVDNGVANSTSACGVASQTTYVLTVEAEDGNAPPQPLSYSWTMVEIPPESRVQLGRQNTPIVWLAPDVPGTYKVAAVVANQSGEWDAREITLLVEAPQLTLVSPSSTSSAMAGKAYGEPIVVAVTTPCGITVAGQPVVWIASNAEILSATRVSGSDGRVSAEVAVGCNLGGPAVISAQLGPQTSFVHPNYSDAKDCLSPDVCLTRMANGGPVINEGGARLQWACGPCDQQTGEFVANVNELKGTCFDDSMVDLLGDTTCLRVEETGSRWNLTWTFWQCCQEGGGFGYERTSADPNDPDVFARLSVEIPVVAGDHRQLLILPARQVPVLDPAGDPNPMPVILTLADVCANPVSGDDKTVDLGIGETDPNPISSGNACFDDLCVDDGGTGQTTKAGVATNGGVASVDVFSVQAGSLSVSATGLAYPFRPAGWVMNGPVDLLETPSRDWHTGSSGDGDGEWQWGVPTANPSSAHSGKRVWATSLSGNYAPATGEQVRWLSKAVDVPCAGRNVLRFWEFHDVAANAVVLLAAGNPLGAPLYPVSASTAYNASLNGRYGYRGTSGSWREVAFDVSEYACSTINVYWTLYLDDATLTASGWAVDDVLVESMADHATSTFLGGSVYAGQIETVRPGVAGCATSPAGVKVTTQDAYGQPSFQGTVDLSITATGAAQVAGVDPGWLVSQAPPLATINVGVLGTTGVGILADTVQTGATVELLAPDATVSTTVDFQAATANETGLCDDGMDNDCDGQVDCADSDCPQVPPGIFVVSGIGDSDTDDSIPLTLGTIPGMAGARVHILKLGICGDSDSSSGPNQFMLSGSGLSVSWEAGQSVSGSDHVLQPSPEVGGSDPHGFSYADVDYRGDVGAEVTLEWTYHNDWDGHYCRESDVLGNRYDDSAIESSVRGWVAYEYVCG